MTGIANFLTVGYGAKDYVIQCCFEFIEDLT